MDKLKNQVKLDLRKKTLQDKSKSDSKTAKSLTLSSSSQKFRKPESKKLTFMSMKQKRFLAVNEKNKNENENENLNTEKEISDVLTYEYEYKKENSFKNIFGTHKIFVFKSEFGSGSESEKEISKISKNPEYIEFSEFQNFSNIKEKIFFEKMFFYLSSVFSVFFSFVFLFSIVFSSFHLKEKLPEFFVSELNAKNTEKIMIPNFLLEEIDNSKTNHKVFTFERKHTIVRYENILDENFKNSDEAISFEKLKSDISKLKSRKSDSISLYDSLENLYFKKEEQNDFSMILVGGYESHFDAFQILKNNDIKATFFIPPGKIEKKGYMTWQEIEEISNHENFEIGATSFDYLKLGQLKYDEQASQIYESKKMLTQKLGKEMKFFYYPDDSYTTDTITLVKYNGFWAGVGDGEINTQILKKTFELKSISNELFL